MDKLTVFMGGTCGDSKWRDRLVPQLTEQVDAFNPVVADWNEEAQKREDAHKANDDINLYVITPATDSTYSFAEIAFSAVEQHDRTVVCFLDEDNGKTNEPHKAKAVKKLTKDLVARDVPVFSSLEELAEFLNGAAEAKCGPLPNKPAGGPNFS